MFDDGYFELTMIKAPKGVGDTTSLINSLMHGRLDSPLVVKRKVKSASFISVDENEWSLDGENGGATENAVIEIKEKALRFIY
jgi:hypothetical protein